jgi:hypothetical protein
MIQSYYYALAHLNDDFIRFGQTDIKIKFALCCGMKMM